MPYAVYEALLMGVPVVALPIGGQAELIGQTPSAQFMAMEVSPRAFIEAATRAAAAPRQEMEKLRKAITEAVATISVLKPLYIVLKTIKGAKFRNADENHKART
jgi:glycosyltransferase involved in cell wall biosynthesis